MMMKVEEGTSISTFVECSSEFRGLKPWMIFVHGVLSLRDSATIFFRKREGYFRMFLVAGLLADFVDQMVFNEEKGPVSFYTWVY